MGVGTVESPHLGDNHTFGVMHPDSCLTVTRYGPDPLHPRALDGPDPLYPRISRSVWNSSSRDSNIANLRSCWDVGVVGGLGDPGIETDDDAPGLEVVKILLDVENH